MKTQYLCLPLRINPSTTPDPSRPTHATTSSSRTATRSAAAASAMLDRFRDAVFRLIMVTALSKGRNSTASAASSTGTRSTTPRSSGAGRGSALSRRSQQQQQQCYSYRAPQDDPQHSEAVADCIEFFKKSSMTMMMVEDMGGRSSTESRSSCSSSNVNDYDEVNMVSSAYYM